MGFNNVFSSPFVFSHLSGEERFSSVDVSPPLVSLHSARERPGWLEILASRF